MSSAVTDNRIVGMYVHQHWPYNHPYCARTWTLNDWRGYAHGLTQLGYNTILVWPMIETIPDPPTPSDVASLEKHRDVIRMLHDDFGMRVYLALCPNVVPDDAKAAAQTFERRHFFSCDLRVNPSDAGAMARMMERRRLLLGYLREADGVSIIDSDPGGYPGSTNEEFVRLLLEHRQLLDELRPGIELIYWMHAGWLGYGRFYQTGVLSFSTDGENLDVLTRLAAANPEPWGLANGLELARRLAIEHRVISFNYGRIEGEPSFPRTNFGGDTAWEGGHAPGPRGVMGNAQTHCVQLPNTFAFAMGARGVPISEGDYERFANELIPCMGDLILAAWKALDSKEAENMRALASELQTRAENDLPTGPLGGLLFGSPQRFLDDLAHQLRMMASYAVLQEASGKPERSAVADFARDASAWQAEHGYENAWWWPDMDATLRKIGSPEVNAVLDSAFNPFVPPPSDIGMTPFEYVAEMLWRTESFTPRLLHALRLAAS